MSDVDDFTNSLMSARPESLEQLIEQLSPAIYESIKTAVELGKWENGQRLSQEQLEDCMQLLILYQAKHFPEEERTGSPLKKDCESAEQESIRIIN